MKRENGLNNRKVISGSVFAVIFFLMGGAALAQQGYGEQDYSGEAGQAATGAYTQSKQSFSDNDVQSFAVASSEVREIRDDYTAKLEGVQDQSKAVEIHQEMNEMMVDAVTSKGLDVETYNAIANQVSFDEQLRNKVDQLMNQQDS